MLPKKLTYSDRQKLQRIVNNRIVSTPMRNRSGNLFQWLGFGSNMLGSVANVLSTVMTNKSNERIAAAQNAMQMAETDKAYERSKASNQVRLMQDAGMSKAGAINAINGGGSYTPAPMTSTPNQAPQFDISHAFDGLIQASENYKQRKADEVLLDKQLQAAKDQQKAQFAENAKQRDHELYLKDIDTANQTQHDYIEYEKHKETLSQQKELSSIDAFLRGRQLDFDKEVFEYNKPLIAQQIEEIKSRTNLNYLHADSAKLDNWRKEFENAQLPELAKLSLSKNYYELLSLVQQYRHAEENHKLDKERKELENKIRSLTADSEISWTNISNELNSYLGSKRLQMYYDDDKYFGGFLGAIEYFINNMLPSIVKIK